MKFLKGSEVPLPIFNGKEKFRFAKIKIGTVMSVNLKKLNAPDNKKGIYDPCCNLDSYLTELTPPLYSRGQKQHLRDFICNRMTIISFWVSEEAKKNSIVAKRVQKNIDEINKFLSELDEEA